MSKETLAKSIREIPDFPIPGILFYDVTTLFKEPAALQELSDTLYEMYKDKGITKISGYRYQERFMMGPILATRLEQASILSASRENFLQKPSKRAMRKNMAKTPCRCTRMPSMKTM